MFFFLVGILIGMHLAQEYDSNIPNVRELVKKASTLLRDAVRGEALDDDRDKSD